MSLKNRVVPIVRNIGKALPVLLLLSFATEEEARAYTDPGTGAMIWQMVAAGAVGVIFYFRKFLTRFKPKKKEEKD